MDYRETTVYDGDVVAVCTACGALVADHTAHTEWHERVAADAR